MVICSLWAAVSIAGVVYQKFVQKTLKRSHKENEENFAKRSVE